MNLFAVRVQFMREAAANLMRRIRQLEIAAAGERMVIAQKLVGPDGPFDRKDPRLQAIVITGENPVAGLPAICEIIRAHVRKPIADPGFTEELEALRGFLNSEVSIIEPEKDVDGGPWYLEPFSSPLRHVANYLIEYLRHFADPKLLRFDPIKICPRCNSLFLQRRAKQEFCSNKCRFERWRADKAGEDPRYWADKAKASRKARRAPGIKKRLLKTGVRQAVARGDGCKLLNHPRKTGVDLGVELLPKPTKKHRKTRKA